MTVVIAFVVTYHSKSEWKQLLLGAVRLEQSNPEHFHPLETGRTPEHSRWRVRFLFVLVEMDSATHIKDKHTAGKVIPLEGLVWLTVGHWWQNRNDVFISPSLPFLTISE